MTCFRAEQGRSARHIRSLSNHISSPCLVLVGLGSDREAERPSDQYQRYPPDTLTNSCSSPLSPRNAASAPLPFDYSALIP